VLVLVRALVYASLFISFFLIFLPARILAWAGISAPTGIGVSQVAGALLAISGGALAIACVLAFALIGRGTPAPFDPPRRLVVRGPYRWIRNPMYAGAVVALAGAALFYRSWVLGGFTLAFWLATAAFVLFYEEPVLSRTFGPEYETYRSNVGRWWPRRVAKAVDR
jgi:protein-S-isoprenylcysteine O-methyltransferase Ste14